VWEDMFLRLGGSISTLASSGLSSTLASSGLSSSDGGSAKGARRGGRRGAGDGEGAGAGGEEEACTSINAADERLVHQLHGFLKVAH
jgi:hypothetical protein